MKADAGPSNLGRCLLVGGVQRSDAHFRQEWQRHKKGLVLELELASGAATIVHDYVSPPDCLPDDPHPAILFKAATLAGDTLWTCTQTEVLAWSLPGFARLSRLSLPCFNDLHHVTPRAGGTLLVANTGLDQVLELAPDGHVERRWNVLGPEPWGRFDPGIDYRKVLTTKPHGSHPNFVFEAEGEIWATRFEQRDAVCLTRPERRLEIGVERPHDGVVWGRRVLFTTVDGHLVASSLADGQVAEVWDLQAMSATDHTLGWCRGLVVLDDEHVLVGFSRLRPTRVRENLRWLRNRLGLARRPGNLPTRIALYNLSTRRLLREWRVEEAGLNVLFSIHPLAPPRLDSP